MSRIKPDNTILRVTALILLLLSIGLFMVEVWDHDFWWHLATGKWIVENGRLPDKDPFSFATIQEDPYTPIDRVKFILTQYWLAQVILYKIYSLWGFAGISILRALLLTATILFLYLNLRAFNVRPYIIVISLLICIYMLRAFPGERPQLFTFLFASVILYLLEMARIHTPYYLIPALPIMLLWANMHGGYVYGDVLALIYLSSEAIKFITHKLINRPRSFDKKRFFIFACIVFLVVLFSFINPNTYNAFIMTFAGHVERYKSFIGEEQSPFILWRENIDFFALTILTTGILLFKWRRLNLTHTLLYVFNLYIAMMASRFIPLFAIVASYLIGRYADITIQTFRISEMRLRKAEKAINLIVLISVLVLLIRGVSNNTFFRTSVNYSEYPAGAVNFVKKNLLPGKMYNAYAWGGFLIWHLYPDYRVFMDGRGLNQEIFLQYMEVKRVERSEEYAGRPKWKAILDSYNIDYMLVSPIRDLVLSKSLLDDTERQWRLIYMDDVAFLFVRDTQEYNEIIRRYEVPKRFAYGTLASQTLAVARTVPSKREKIKYYLISVDAFIKAERLDRAKSCLEEAYKITPDYP